MSRDNRNFTTADASLSDSVDGTLTYLHPHWLFQSMESVMASRNFAGNDIGAFEEFEALFSEFVL